MKYFLMTFVLFAKISFAVGPETPASLFCVWSDPASDLKKIENDKKLAEESKKIDELHQKYKQETNAQKKEELKKEIDKISSSQVYINLQGYYDSYANVAAPSLVENKSASCGNSNCSKVCVGTVVCNGDVKVDRVQVACKAFNMNQSMGYNQNPYASFNGLMTGISYPSVVVDGASGSVQMACPSATECYKDSDIKMQRTTNTYPQYPSGGGYTGNSVYPSGGSSNSKATAF